jgi:glycerol-3-phosphate acyltransferase PlsY
MYVTVMLMVTAVICYLLGNPNGSILISGIFFRDDIRRYGSGNAGLTNYFRKYGVKFIALVLLIDFGKGVLATFIGGWLMKLVAQDPKNFVEFVATGRLFGAFCVILGHSWPFIYGFRGGKGVLTGFGAAFVVDWRAGLICLAAFLILFLATKYVSLGSITAAVSFPITLFAVDYRGVALALAFFCAITIIVRHSENIKSLIAGRERKFTTKRDISYKLDKNDF